MAEIDLVTSKGGIKRWLGRATGEARVEASVFEAEERAAENGDAYIFSAIAQTKAAVSGTLCYIKNTLSTRSIVMGRLFVDALTVTSLDLVISQVISPSSATLGTDLSSTGIVQKNTGAQNILKNEIGMFMVADALGAPVVTGGGVMHNFNLAPLETSLRNMHGTNVIAPGGVWALNWASVAGALAGEQVSLSLNCYLADVDRE